MDQTLKKSQLIGIIALFSLLLPVQSFSAEWKFRAREHYEFHNLKFNGVEADYRGFSNTINFWYESPFNLSYGFAAGSILSGFSTNDSRPLALSDEIEMYFVGFEAKLFPFSSLKGFFGRAGLDYRTLDSNSSASGLDGISASVSAGWEFLAWDDVGIAPEVGLRLGDLNGLTMQTFNISLGVHFY